MSSSCEVVPNLFGESKQNPMKSLSTSLMQQHKEVWKWTALPLVAGFWHTKGQHVFHGHLVGLDISWYRLKKTLKVSTFFNETHRAPPSATGPNDPPRRFVRVLTSHKTKASPSHSSHWNWKRWKSDCVVLFLQQSDWDLVSLSEVGCIPPGRQRAKSRPKCSTLQTVIFILRQETKGLDKHVR